MSTKRFPARCLFWAALLVPCLLLLACGVASPTATSPTATPASKATQALTAQATQSAATQPPQPTSPPKVANTLNVTVKATDAIYLAGRTDVTIPVLDAEDPAFPLLRCGGESLESMPTPITIKPGATFTFQAKGMMDYYGSESPSTAPDSDVGVPSGVEGLGAISGYTGPAGGLVGLFLGDANPAKGSAPDPLDFSETGVGAAFAQLTPALGQVFFIGDGLTGTGEGAPQTFVAPAGATRLFLGTVDASNFYGPPGCYGDNSGSYQVQVTSSAPLSLTPAGSQASAGASATPAAQVAATAKLTSAAQATATTATAATKPASAAQATATKAPTAKPGATSPAGLASGPKSYRMHAVTRLDDPQGDVKEDFLGEVVIDPLAIHYKSTGGGAGFEVVIVGKTLWSRFGDSPWHKTDLAEEDLQAQLEQFSQQASPMKIKEETPQEDGIGWLVGQPSLKIAEGSLTQTGAEKVNGVACKRYKVNSVYSYTVEFTAPISATGVVGVQIKGEIWVADESGWSPFVVRERVTEINTTTVSRNTKTETLYKEQDVTDINQPIKIEPPQ